MLKKLLFNSQRYARHVVAISLFPYQPFNVFIFNQSGHLELPNIFVLQIRNATQFGKLQFKMREQHLFKTAQ